jgi:hypothetical protein
VRLTEHDFGPEPTSRTLRACLRENEAKAALASLNVGNLQGQAGGRLCDVGREVVGGESRRSIGWRWRRRRPAHTTTSDEVSLLTFDRSTKNEPAELQQPQEK